MEIDVVSKDGDRVSVVLRNAFTSGNLQRIDEFLLETIELVLGF